MAQHYDLGASSGGVAADVAARAPSRAAGTANPLARLAGMAQARLADVEQAARNVAAAAAARRVGPSTSHP